MRKRPPVLVVAPGAETSWAGDAEVTTQATVVAVDGEGRLAGFGSEAALAAAARGDALRLFQPFSATEIFSVDLTRAYLRWVIESWPAGGRHPVLAFLLPDCAADGVDRWKAVCDSLGVGFITISRPVAAAAGLGLDVDSGAADMIVDVRSDAAEVAVVADGGVLFSRTCYDPTPSTVASTVRSALVQIDPDLEWDVLSGGIHLLGRIPGKEWTDELSKTLGVRVGFSSEAERVLIAGARSNLEGLESYLWSVTPGVGRLLRGVLAGFGH
ncbi:MAG TPA: rod shape-determining protein [Acidimicrobiia bacterium]|nr:rod shape-determining protein [Acidimicrobiia bacterium]